MKDLKEKGYDYLKKITAVDYVDHVDVVYILYNIDSKKDELVIVRLKPENPSLPTVLELFKAADWYERELSEMFGINIEGRSVKKLLLEEWNGAEAPLRKSFVWAKDYKKRD
ncbi:MAG: NADH-quinone oxidoreductase subunit C [Candidatus Micrarchaeia archaeon]